MRTPSNNSRTRQVLLIAAAVTVAAMVPITATPANAQVMEVASTEPGWTTKSKKSNLDGSSLVDLTLDAVGSAGATGAPGGSVTPNLVLRCVEHAIWATVVTGPALPGSAPEHAMIDYSLDGKAPVKQSWNQLPSGNAVSAPDASGFIKILLDAKHMRFEAPVGKDGASRVLNFRVAGLSKVIGSLTRACGPIGKTAP